MPKPQAPCRRNQITQESCELWRVQVVVSYAGSSFGTYLEDPAGCVATRHATLNGRDADMRIFSKLPDPEDSQQRTSSTLNPFAFAETTVSHGRWTGYSVSSAGSKTHSSPSNHGSRPSLHRNPSVPAHKSASNPQPTSSGPTSRATFCPPK
jgi:hypothetical protein